MLCFKCDTKLEPVIDEIPERQPYGGTVFNSYGNYGSTVYDPIVSTEFIEIFICDGCLIRNKEKVLKIIVNKPKPIDPTIEEWIPKYSSFEEWYENTVCEDE